MGTIEYVKCNDCKKFIEIDKLTRHKWYDETDIKELSEDKDDFDDYDRFHISRLLGFLNSHQGCNIEFFCIILWIILTILFLIINKQQLKEIFLN